MTGGRHSIQSINLFKIMRQAPDQYCQPLGPNLQIDPGVQWGSMPNRPVEGMARVRPNTQRSGMLKIRHAPSRDHLPLGLYPLRHPCMLQASVLGQSLGLGSGAATVGVLPVMLASLAPMKGRQRLTQEAPQTGPGTGQKPARKISASMGQPARSIFGTARGKPGRCGGGLAPEVLARRKREQAGAGPAVKFEWRAELPSEIPEYM